MVADIVLEVALQQQLVHARKRFPSIRTYFVYIFTSVSSLSAERQQLVDGVAVQRALLLRRTTSMVSYARLRSEKRRKRSDPTQVPVSNPTQTLPTATRAAAATAIVAVVHGHACCK